MPKKEDSTPPVQKKMVKNFTIFVWVVVAVVLVLNIILGMWLQKHAVTSKKNNAAPTQTVIQPLIYQGVEGKDALTLLKAKTSVGQNASGLVTSIGGKKADDSKHEYWEFFVNGKSSNVGPAQYITKNGDQLEWKIGHY